MKKLQSFLAALIILLSLFSGVGCSEADGGYQIDPNKTQIYVHVTNGGYGYSWLEQAAEDWGKEPGNEKYEIIPVSSIEEDVTKIKSNYESGAAEDIYFMSHSGIQQLISAGIVADLNDLVQQKPDGGKTVEELLKYPDTVRGAFSDEEGNLYAIPYGDSFLGLVFDFDLFYDAGWLITDGMGNLSAGKDGKPGTYDDGQPVNIAEWETMLNKIKNSGNAYPFIYTTKYIGYLDQIIYALVAQYAGLEDYNTFIDYEGSYKDANGQTVTVPLSEGYKVYEMPAFEKAAAFLHDYLFLDQSMVYPSSWDTTEFTHRDAQNKFIIGYKQTSDVPLGAMLAEGIWWENEARSMFNSLEDRGDDKHAYGQVDYRYMLFPDMEGQVGANGDGTGSVFSAMDAGAAFVLKSDDAEKQAKAEDFLLYTCKEKYLKLFTQSSGAVRPYYYELSEQELAEMTPFQRNVWAIYSDTENVTIIRPAMERFSTRINYATSKMDDRFYGKFSTAGYGISKAFSLHYSTSEYLQAVKAYNQGEWTTFMEELER